VVSLSDDLDARSAMTFITGCSIVIAGGVWIPFHKKTRSSARQFGRRIGADNVVTEDCGCGLGGSACVGMRGVSKT